MKQHRYHDHIPGEVCEYKAVRYSHCIPVGVPLDLYDPLPEVQVKSENRKQLVDTDECYVSPDPDTHTEVGEGNDQT